MSCQPSLATHERRWRRNVIGISKHKSEYQVILLIMDNLFRTTQIVLIVTHKMRGRFRTKVPGKSRTCCKRRLIQLASAASELDNTNHEFRDSDRLLLGKFKKLRSPPLDYHLSERNSPPAREEKRRSHPDLL